MRTVTYCTENEETPLGIAGLWDEWRDEDGRRQLSFTMLTVNADEHPLMRHYHKPGDEKRMLVMLPRGLYQAWLEATPDKSMDFLRQFPADRLADVTTHGLS